MAEAEIYFTRKDWANAKDKYLAAESAAPAAYTAGLNLFNAAVCAEEMGDSDSAVEYLEKAVSLENFSLKTRALFNVGRIQENLGQVEKAIAAYERLTGDYAEDEWTNLAKSRLIQLSVITSYSIHYTKLYDSIADLPKLEEGEIDRFELAR